MKKLLSILGSITLIGAGPASLVACSKEKATLKDLSSVLTNTKLGDLANKEEKTIKNVIKEKNKNIVIDELVLSSITEKSAKISVRKDSKVYNQIATGSEIILEFSIKATLKDLSTDLTITKLGELPNNDEKTIKNAIKEKNKNILIEELVLSSITEKSAKISVRKDSKVYNQIATGSEIILEFSIKATLKDLSTDLTITKLGELPNNDEKTIKNAIKEKNKNILIEELVLSSITEKSAKISVRKDSKVYNQIATGSEIILEFSIKATLKDLSTDLTITKLGELPNNDEKTIKNAIKEKNKNILIEELVLSSITEKSAKISVRKDSKVYNQIATGSEIIFEFSIKATLKDLSTDLTITKLGELPNNDEKTIKNAIKEKNKNILIEELVLSSITEKSAKISVRKDSKVYNQIATGSEIILEFSIKATLKDLSTDLIITKLGELPNNDEKSIKNAIKEKNKNILIEELVLSSITEKSAKISVRKDSKVYNQIATGSEIILEFSIKVTLKDLSTDLIITKLGELPNNDEKSIKNAIKEKNKNILIEELVLSSITEKSAKISVRKDSKVYNQIATGSEIILEFSIKVTLKDLSTDLTITDLGIIKDKNKETILAAIKKKNKNVDVNEIQVGWIYDDEAWVYVGKTSKVYKELSLKSGIKVIYQIG